MPRKRTDECECSAKGQCQKCRGHDLFNAGIRMGEARAKAQLQPIFDDLVKRIDAIQERVRDLIGYERIKSHES